MAAVASGGKYDDSNVFVLPAGKRETKIVREKKESHRILSKSKRKKLEKIVDSKKKKANVISGFSISIPFIFIFLKIVFCYREQSFWRHSHVFRPPLKNYQ